jgi:zinc protease
VFGREAGGLLTRGDARFSFPSETDLKSATTDDLKALLAGPLAHGRIEITIVGDITPERAMALVGETFGALPARDPAPPAPPARELEVRFPDPTPSPLLRTDKGRPDQAVAVAAWPAPDFYADMKRSRAIMLASEILGNRLVEKLRFAQGGTYSPQTQSDLSQVYPGYGYVLNLVEMPPPLIPAFFDTVRATAADLAATGPTPDELERARNPHVAGLKKAQLTNEYWIADLTGAQGDPRHLALIRTTFPDYEAITAADIKAAARDVFKDDAAWRMVVKAQDAPAKAP